MASTFADENPTVLRFRSRLGFPAAWSGDIGR
jgi:hypothetical protein